jgi:hydrogenase maturation protease
MRRHPASTCLVIGIGNPLRGDDGVGALLAEQAAAVLETRVVQQLTPELAVELAQLEAVLFMDAWLAPAGAAPQLLEVSPAAGAAESHRLEPAELLAISKALYGRAPVAHLLQVPAHALEHGTALSPQLQANLPAARALLQGWLAAACSSHA